MWIAYTVLNKRFQLEVSSAGFSPQVVRNLKKQPKQEDPCPVSRKQTVGMLPLYNG
jgi:hypothetical protein